MAKILVADDERDIRDLICFTIRFDGHEVFVATNGEEVLELGTQVIPDLFLLDVRMPRMNGYEACRILKQIPELKNIPVVFLTAKGNESEIQQGLEAGAARYLLKPFAPDQLIREIQGVLRDSRLDLLSKEINGNDVKFEPADIAYLVRYLNDLKKEHAATIKDISSRHKRQIQSYEQKIQELQTLVRAERLQRPSFLATLSQTFSNLLFKSASPQTKESPTVTDQATPSVINYPLEELSRITDGIVHDMRNGIGIIRNTIGFMNDDLSNTSHAKDVLKISRSLDFCEVVLRNLSALGGQEIIRPERVNLESIVREIFFMLENKLVDVKLIVESDESQPTIFADQGHMKQVFMNLIKNAGEAMPDGGILTCRFKRENDMMKIEIEDTGHGISKANQKRLFNEFFTTKERGYGIGLFVVHSIVERHGGKISVESKEHNGTTFTLLLPVGE